MHFGAMMIAAQMLATVAVAQTPPEKAVSILNDICVAPPSSEEKIAAGEKRAVKENWKLIESGAAPMPFMHNENGVKNSFFSAWQIELSEGSRATLYVSILRPEPPNFKYTLCVIQPEADLDNDDLTKSIDRQLGSDVTMDMTDKFKDQKSWFFVAEKSKGNCGKRILLMLHQLSDRGKPKTLMFTDFDGSAVAALTRCN